jgi:hypothetical protein
MLERFIEKADLNGNARDFSSDPFLNITLVNGSGATMATSYFSSAPNYVSFDWQSGS